MQYAFGRYELDTGARTLRQRGEEVAIQDRAFDVLVYLIEHRERFVSPDELLDALWPGVSVSPAAVSQAVRKARQAVGDDGECQAVLRTKHGQGFRFVAEVIEASAPAAAATMPAISRARVAALAGLVALLVTTASVWLQSRPVAEPPPAGSVAVLPFVNMGQDASAEPFASGIYDDILTHISRIHGLTVIARTTMERLAPNLGIQEIGRQLRVATVLEAGVRRNGDRIRINVQLIDCETETHLWAETYDRELSAVNIFAIQGEIATAVARALKATLSARESDRLATIPTENLAAYEAYLLGKQHLARLTNAALVEAGEHFEQATEIDPNYALAYVGLAESYALQAFFSSSRANDAKLMKAQAAVNKALELDDRLGEAYTSLAGIREERRDFEGAEAAYRRALELNPNYETTYRWYGVLLQLLGRQEEALSMYLKAAELNPLSPVARVNVGWTLEALGRFEESLTWFESAVEIDPDFDAGYAGIGFHHQALLGQLDEAVVAYMKVLALLPDEPIPATLVESNDPANLGWALLDLGDFSKAEYWFERSIELGPGRPEGRMGMSFLHLYRGDEAAAVDRAREVLEDFPRRWGPLLLLRNHELGTGRVFEARTLYETTHPELLNRGDLKVDGTNWGPALDLALVLFKTGERERANLLLDQSLEFIHSLPRLGRAGYGTADAQIFALQGKMQEALSALRQAIDEGWRGDWRYVFEHEPNLESLRGEPEFQAMLEDVRAEMATQLEHVREMERAGELAAISRNREPARRGVSIGH